MDNGKILITNSDEQHFSHPVLTTKLFIPQPHESLVSRSRLFEILNSSQHSNVILISAPAGFGKTTLMSDWINNSQLNAAWLSLDNGDNDPIHFLTYLIAALQTINPGIGTTALNLLKAPKPSVLESCLIGLINSPNLILIYCQKVLKILKMSYLIQK